MQHVKSELKHYNIVISEKLIIAFDAKRAAKNRTGLGNYSRYVLKGITSSKSDIISLLCTPHKSEIEEYLNILKKKNVSELYPTPSKLPLGKAYWRSRGIGSALKEQHVRIYHGLSNEIPFGLKSANIKSVVTIHDLIFRRYPKFYPVIDRTIYDRKFKYACKHADRIVAISECTKRDIIELYGINQDKIEVIYQGCSPRFSEAIPKRELDEVRRRYDLPERYILSVGSIEERKNVRLIVEALPLIKEEIPLVLIGKRTSYTKTVEETARRLKVSHRVRIIENLPFADLPSMYRMATIFVYPSRYEGFGIPIVEALVSGVPVVGATGSCLEEAGGPDSLYTNPDNHEELSRMIDQVLSNLDLQKIMITKGIVYAQRFNLQQSSNQLLSLYWSLC